MSWRSVVFLLASKWLTDWTLHSSEEKEEKKKKKERKEEKKKGRTLVVGARWLANETTRNNLIIRSLIGNFFPFFLFEREKKREIRIPPRLGIIERSSANTATSLTLIANTVVVFSSARPSDYYAIINDAVRRQSHVSRKLTLEPRPRWRGSYFIFVASCPVSLLERATNALCQTRLQLTQPVLRFSPTRAEKKKARTNGCNRTDCTIATRPCPALPCSAPCCNRLILEPSRKVD